MSQICSIEIRSAQQKPFVAIKTSILVETQAEEVGLSRSYRNPIISSEKGRGSLFTSEKNQKRESICPKGWKLPATSEHERMQSTPGFTRPPKTYEMGKKRTFAWRFKRYARNGNHLKSWLFTQML